MLRCVVCCSCVLRRALCLYDVFSALESVVRVVLCGLRCVCFARCIALCAFVLLCVSCVVCVLCRVRCGPLCVFPCV